MTRLKGPGSGADHSFDHVLMGRIEPVSLEDMRAASYAVWKVAPDEKSFREVIEALAGGMRLRPLKRSEQPPEPLEDPAEPWRTRAEIRVWARETGRKVHINGPIAEALRREYEEYKRSLGGEIGT